MRGQAQVLSSARTGAGSDDWQSPACVLDRVRLIAPIWLDPCTSKENPTGASGYYTIEDDALAIEWTPGGLTYVNPPYSKMAAWALKVSTFAATGTPIIVLVAARPDTRWWRSLWNVADVVGFWRGRLSFIGPALAKPCPAPFPSALLGINTSQRRFRQAFGDVAEIVLPT